MDEIIDNLSTDQLKAIAKEYALGIGATPEYVNPKQNCQLNHAGQCGVCEDDGTFVPCG